MKASPNRSYHWLEPTLTCTYSLTCIRAASQLNHLPKLSSRRPQVVLIDASGIKVCGEGEWKVKPHGKLKRREWIKLHIAVDAHTQEIIGQEVTHAHSCKENA